MKNLVNDYRIPKMLKKITGPLLLILISALMAILIGEFAIRMIYPQKTLFPRFIESEDYPIAFPRNTRLINSQGTLWQYVYTTNELGKRGTYTTLSDAKNTTNIISLGDSFTFGIGVNDKEVYTEVLSKQLGNNYSVVNGGMGGWGIDSEIKWYYQYGVEYKPKYVTLQFTANDPDDSYAGVTTVENSEFKFFPYTKRRPSWQLLLSRTSFVQKSHLYVLTRSILDNLQQRSQANQIKENQSNKKQLNYIKMLRLFSEKLKKANVKLLFISVTHQDSKEDSYKYDIEKFPLIHKEISSLEEAEQIHFIDLPLSEMANKPGSPEGHQWSYHHHNIVGEVLAKKISLLEGRGQ